MMRALFRTVKNTHSLRLTLQTHLCFPGAIANVLSASCTAAMNLANPQNTPPGRRKRIVLGHHHRYSQQPNSQRP